MWKITITEDYAKRLLINTDPFPVGGFISDGEWLIYHAIDDEDNRAQIKLDDIHTIQKVKSVPLSVWMESKS